MDERLKETDTPDIENSLDVIDEIVHNIRLGILND